MNHATNKDDGRTAAEAETAELTPQEAELLAQVLAERPTLTRDEALRQLRAAGM